MGDRVAVMSDGLLTQVGDPRTVYERPANVFVAGFIGSPSMSFANMTVSSNGGGVVLSHGDLRIQTGGQAASLPPEVIVGVRPEHARIWEDGGKLLGPLSGRAEYVEMLGRETLIGVGLADDTRLVVQADADANVAVGDTVPFGVEGGRLHLFHPETKTALGRI